MELGQKVKIKSKLHRFSKYREGPKTKRVWIPMYFPDGPVEGLVIGKRTLSNGFREYMGFEEGVSYDPTDHFEAYLVATDIRKKPFYTLKEDLEIINY